MPKFQKKHHFLWIQGHRNGQTAHCAVVQMGFSSYLRMVLVTPLPHQPYVIATSITEMTMMKLFDDDDYEIKMMARRRIGKGAIIQMMWTFSRPSQLHLWPHKSLCSLQLAKLIISCIRN